MNMNVSYDVLLKIFEYLSCHQLWKLQYINKTIGQKMKEHEWRQTFCFKENINSKTIDEVMTEWNIKKINWRNYTSDLSNNIVNILKNIKKLNITTCSVNIVNELFKMVNLEELNVYQPKVQIADSEADPSYEEIAKVEDTFNSIITKNISKLTKLKKICLEYDFYDTQCIDGLENLTKLPANTNWLMNGNSHHLKICL